MGPLAGSLRVQRDGVCCLGSSNQVYAESSSQAARESSRGLAALLTPDVTLPWRVTGRGVFHRWALLAGGVDSELGDRRELPGRDDHSTHERNGQRGSPRLYVPCRGHHFWWIGLLACRNAALDPALPRPTPGSLAQGAFRQA